MKGGEGWWGGDCKTTKESCTGGREGERTGRNEPELEIKEWNQERKEWETKGEGRM